ncbi:MAG: glycosyltransferase, partial [Candidatus Brocadiales bacterium]|nr:glycosyltransferase [Candidatus Brocadiales bacterium]
AYTDVKHFGAANRIICAGEYDFKRLCLQNHLNYCSLYRREAWESAGGYNPNMVWGYEDWDFWISCGEKGYYGKRLSEPLFMYRVQETSMYTKALEHHSELMALIILNHPNLYDPQLITEAKKILNQCQRNATQPHPLVTVIVPTYNRSDTLKRTLESIAAQTYKRIEAIVVNDAGEDVSGVIDTFHDRLSIKYLVHDKNKGLAAVRNTAIKHAAGQYIAYLDDDDIFHPHHIETAVKVLTTTNYKAVYTDAYRAYQTKKGDTYQVIKKDIPYSIDYVKGIFYKTNITPVLCVVHDRTCFNEAGIFDETLTVLEDWDLWIRMSEKYDFYHIREVTCEFSWRADGTSTTSSKQDEFTKIRELIYKKYRNNFQKLLLSQNTTDKLISHPPLQKPVSIIILTWNALDYTQKCVHSIQNHTNHPHEIVFVDNASTDGTVEYLRKLIKEHPNYKLIENHENKGFAVGNNQGVAIATGEYVMLLNNDVLVSDGWLESLVESLEMDKNIGMVGPITNSISGRQQVNKIPYTDEQGFYKFAQEIRKTYKGRLTPRYRVAGFAVLMRKALYEDAGGLDESFGTGNYEDDDLCLKVSRKGYAIMVDESVFIHHY